MIRRRGLVRGISALVVGSALGVSAATATAAPPEPTPFHATGRTAGAGTTLTARVDPSLPETIGLPAGVGSIRPGPGDRYPSVDPDAFGPVSASVGIEGSRVAGGCAVAEGSIDAEVRRALSPAREAFDGVEAWDSFECGAVPEPGYAIGVADSTLAVGYGQDDAAAVDHAASGARRAAGNAEADRVAPAALSGDAVAYATLGGGTRSRLRSRADSSVDGLDLLLGAVEAVGVAVEVGRAKSRLRYGAVVDPSSLSAGEASKLARGVAGDGRLDVDAVSRHGRLLVVESTVATDAFWRAHGASIEALSE